MFFRRRASDKDDPWLTEKLWLFTLGGVAALVGMLMDNTMVMILGALLLVGGIILRFLPRPD